MKSKSKIRLTAFIFSTILILSSFTGCAEKKSQVYESKPEESSITSEEESSEESSEKDNKDSSKEEKSKNSKEELSEESENESSTESSEESSEESSKESEETVNSVVAKAKKYIVEKAVMESVTDVTYENINTQYDDSRTVRKAKLESGFNDEFYYIIENSSTQYGQNPREENPGYEFYINDEWGVIDFSGNNYKIISPIVLRTCKLKDLKADTLCEMIISEIIVDKDFCELKESEDGKYWIIEQRLEYQDLAINKANSCSFYGSIDSSTMVRQTIKFEKETCKMVESDVVCSVVDVASFTEDNLTVHSEYSYEKTHSFDFDIDSYKEIDSFKGYSIY